MKIPRHEPTQHNYTCACRKARVHCKSATYRLVGNVRRLLGLRIVRTRAHDTHNVHTNTRNEHT